MRDITEKCVMDPATEKEIVLKLDKVKLQFLEHKKRTKKAGKKGKPKSSKPKKQK